jgi:predicted ester cyclase
MEAVNNGTWREAFDALFTTTCVFHEPFAPQGLVAGLQGLKDFAYDPWFAAFPDIHFAVEDLIAEGDRVAARVTMRGTHQGDLMGIPPTGKQVSWTGIEIDRIKDGKYVESWLNTDDLGLMQQLGVIPQMAQAGG